VALWGYSMGAWYAGTAVCYDARLAAVVMASPPARHRPGLEQRAVRPRIRANVARIREVCARLNVTPMSLATIRPAISGKNILLIEGIYDLLCPKEDIGDLWRVWDSPTSGGCRTDTSAFVVGSRRVYRGAFCVGYRPG